jgi:uncharacterized repeat protein (TIGR03803 family)
MNLGERKYSLLHCRRTIGGLKALFGSALMLVLAATMIAPWRSAWANPLTLIPVHNFDCPIGKCPSDGAQPYAGLVMDAAGDLYGTTVGGGDGLGTVFELKPTKTAGKITGWNPPIILYNFCPQGSVLGCTDGYLPHDSLILDGSGNLYGTTQLGGNTANCPTTAGWPGPGCGVVFKLTPPGAGAPDWQYNVLYRFCSEPNCADGALPSGVRIMDGSGNLYGETAAGGTTNANCTATVSARGCGMVFELPPNATAPTVLYNFCANANCADGATPSGGLIWDGSGNLYGTTVAGGANSSASACQTGCGTAFELTAPLAEGSERVLYSFCAKGGASCTDGLAPDNGLIADDSGNLFGTTLAGGSAGFGAVFELTRPPIGRITPLWDQAVLHSFGSFSGDGQQPYGSLVVDCMSNLYGATAFGGANSRGMAYELVAREEYAEAPLYNFCSKLVPGVPPICQDGGQPQGGLIMDRLGDLYGTAYIDGPDGNYGAVFELQ